MTKSKVPWILVALGTALGMVFIPYSRHVKRENDNLRAAAGESKIDRKLAKKRQ